MITYDDSNLWKLFEDLSEKRRKTALRSAFTQAATKVRKGAIENLKGSGIRVDRDLEKGIRRLVYKDTLGFRVTIGTTNGKKASGFHTNRRGEKKPVLLWAEGGTKGRYTKTKTKFFKRLRKGHYTGRMRAYEFMLKTKNQFKDKVTSELHDAIITKIQQTAKKYGCS